MILPAFSKTYDGVRVLNFHGMALQKGQIYAVIGANGSGKSTFAKLLAGILPADDKTVISLKPYTVGYMPQKTYAYRMSVRANIAMCGAGEDKITRLMDALQLTHLAKKRADKLSGGETARMALARLLSKPFELLILDEPTATLDMETTILAEEQIRNYVEENNCAVILVTHSLQQAKRLADEVLFFDKGILIENGPATQVLASPLHEATAAFLNFYGR